MLLTYPQAKKMSTDERRPNTKRYLYQSEVQMMNNIAYIKNNT